MKYNESNIRLILGLKVRQLRMDKGLSLKELSDKTGISVSYLNEIEKGKKNPKPAKLSELAEALGSSYDWLVSLQLNKKLAPIKDILKSNILQDLPLEIFGINGSKMMELFSTDPTRVGAFVNTIIEIARSYNFTLEQFYFNALRAYQEMQDNYFPDLEKEAEIFRASYLSHISNNPSSDELRDLLIENYSYNIRFENFQEMEDAEDLRSILMPGDSPILLLNTALNEHQKAFIYARELGFNHLGLKERPYTFSFVKVESFDEVLNNFQASYFAGALLINKDEFLDKLKSIFGSDKWKPQSFVEMAEHFHSSPEMIMHRLTSLGPKFMGFDKLFFLRINHSIGSKSYFITKELHLSGQHNPHSNLLEEHYCRRWVSIRSINELANEVKNNPSNLEVKVDAQVSDYYDSNNKYLVISMARAMHPTENEIASVSIGILLNNKSSEQIAFLNDNDVKAIKTGQTCERCSATDCMERVAEARILRQASRMDKKAEAIKKLIENYGK